MKYYLPSYEDCVRICNQPESTFYETKHIVGGYNISLFNYRITLYNDFKNPIEGVSDIDAFELRGLTFVFNKDGSVYKRFILLQKFFNLNQVESSLYDVVSNYRIKSIYNKEDGSVASFIELPDGSVVGKSKMGFESDQAIGANRVYRTNKDIKSFVDWTIENNLVAIFEYVAPDNRIVLKYNSENLILLKVRDNSTGCYINLEDIRERFGDTISITDNESSYTLDELVELQKTTIDKEGWVIHSIDNNGRDYFYKIKTEWYFTLHSLFTDDLYREHLLVKHILNDEIDDIVAQVPIHEKDTLNRIERITEIVREDMNHRASKIRELVDIYNTSGLSIRDFAIKYNKNKFFGYSIRIINDRDVSEYDLSKQHILKKYNKLTVTREWLREKDSSLFDI